ncbi:MAG: radical SAM protein [Dehalococcoidales bacterium]|nr:radical SAM protein [Dehalococcoidales bacterium]
MKFTYIRPSLIPAGVAGDSIEPLVFAILSGLTPPDIDRVLYDQRIEVIPFDEPTDLAVLTIDTFTAKSAYQIAAQYHLRGVPVIAGGIHPTLCPREALRFVDSVVIGDAEGVWHEVVRDARGKKLKPVYEKRYPSLDRLQFDRSIFKGKRYLPVTLVQFGRGCRFSCEYCSVHALYGSNIRQRPVDAVVEEIRKTGRKPVIFTDDNLFVDNSATNELLRALTPLGIKWGCQASLDISANRDLIRLMAQSGCIAVTIGFESLITGNLKQMGKRLNLNYGSYLEAVRIFRKHGIMVCGAFIFGYDQDTLDSFKISLDFAIKAKLYTANLNTLVPFPATPLYERLRREGRLIHDPWWLHPDFRFGQAPFRPAKMTPEQLEDRCYWVRSEFNKYGSIARRALDLHANFSSPTKAGVYLKVNLLTRKEISRKRYQPLGDGSDLTPLFDGDRL